MRTIQVYDHNFNNKKTVLDILCVCVSVSISSVWCVCVWCAGKINLRNLRRVARELEENMSEEELRAMIEEFDTDNDGESELHAIDTRI